jgi:hypothetical protein
MNSLEIKNKVISNIMVFSRASCAARAATEEHLSSIDGTPGILHVGIPFMYERSPEMNESEMKRNYNSARLPKREEINREGSQTTCKSSGLKVKTSCGKGKSKIIK